MSLRFGWRIGIAPLELGLVGRRRLSRWVAAGLARGGHGIGRLLYPARVRRRTPLERRPFRAVVDGRAVHMVRPVRERNEPRLDAIELGGRDDVLVPFRKPADELVDARFAIGGQRMGRE